MRDEDQWRAEIRAIDLDIQRQLDLLCEQGPLYGDAQEQTVTFHDLTRTYVDMVHDLPIPTRVPPPLETGCAACRHYAYPAHLQGWVKERVCSCCPPHVHEGTREDRPYTYHRKF